MPGLILHPDQTNKQPVVWMCQNADCTGPLRRSFDFISDYPICPKCGADGDPTVQKRVLIHLLVRDPKGPIAGERGSRWRLACDGTREHLATHTNGEAATGDPTQINCPGCTAHLGRGIKSGAIAITQDSELLKT